MLLPAAALSLVAAGAAFASSGPSPTSVCIGVPTPPALGLSVDSPRRGLPRTLVLCVSGREQSPLAVRTFVDAACRGEWKATRFAVRYGGGDYTTFRDCLTQKTTLATASLARARSTGARVCAAQLAAAAARPWYRSPGNGFGVWVLDGRC
jgi:hypothetical protein